jgi:hypothetical protein
MEVQDKLPNPQAKKNTTKPKKDTRKWCEFQKSSTHNTTECWVKQSQVAEMTAYESDPCSHNESDLRRGMLEGSILSM